MIMNSKHFFRRSFPGSALAYGLIIMTIVSIVLTFIITVITGQVKYALQVHAREQAFQITESGIHFYRWYLAHQVEGRTAQQVEDFWTGGTAYGVGTAYEVEYIDPNGSAIGKYSITVVPPESGGTSLTVTATGWTYRYPDIRRTVIVRFRRPSWSESAVLANDFMRFGAGTEVYGRVHSNQGIRFDGVAHNVISSAVSTYNDPDHTGGNEFGVHTHDAPTDPLPPAAVPDRADVFEAGRSFPDPTVDFNGVLGDLSNMKSVAQAGTGRYFDNSGSGRQITLLSNGTFDACTVNSYSVYNPSTYAGTNGITNYLGTVSGATGTYSSTNGTSCTTTSCCTYSACPWIQASRTARGRCVSKSNYPIVDKGVIFVEDNIWLSGQISDRRISVVAADLLGGNAPSVFIRDDIMYSAYDGSDILGVIGQNDVEIIRDSDTTLRIDAALLAQQGRVGREYYDGRIKSSITVYGAIATNQRYGFAYTDGTGYQTRNLYYDNSLLYYPPPYFPTGTQYEMDLWEEL
jgi:hypothetical protein